jgi:hypothetical protein
MTKYKRGKKAPADISIEKKHRENIEQLLKLEESLPEKKKELVKLRKEVLRLERKEPSLYTNADILAKANIKDKISMLEETIKKIENKEDQSRYILSAAPVLETYYNSKKNQDQKAVSFQELLTGQAKMEDSKNNYNDQYMEAINVKKKAHKRRTDRCNKENCHGQMILNQDEGNLICIECGKIGPIIMDVERSGSRESNNDKVPYAYKRQNHLKEILTQIQAHHVVDIPEEDLQKIKDFIKQKRLRRNEIDYSKMKKILKKLEMDRHYEHTSFILYRVCKIKPPQFAREAVQEIERRFAACQKPFYKYKPPGRKNFLSYSYVLHKLFEMIGFPEYCKYFRLLKNKKKLQLQEEIWFKICQYLGWKFIPCGKNKYY